MWHLYYHTCETPTERCFNITFFIILKCFKRIKKCPKFHTSQMKYNKVQILYDKKGDITGKLGKNVVTVLILPNAQVLESYWESSS